MIIACLGDSLTYGYGIPRPKIWTTLLARRTGIDVRNCGINGDTTGGMLARFHQHVVQAGADAVLIMGGFNDLALGTGLGTVRANIFALVQQSFSARVRPVLGVPIPVHAPITFPLLGSVDLPRACADYAVLHQWLRVLAEDFSLQCVDFSQTFASFSGQDDTEDDNAPDRLSALYTDGLHPSEAGHELMSQQAARILG
ncbi:MAG TPA: GDSL-type esterase/lipase family protein [Desulfovibrio sp.]|uniref:GDSL-type esterase/lipase family protein n=1 Tax=Desulfovibrio sp. TaxID=885 RepID=UPI002D3183A0|nr:GDSL-type esterase/lipase family protein [Desulfovibrio sp.]HZF61406.1 GDSL-type esterase/lipase family protein [Desulfovibrio sp.]